MSEFYENKSICAKCGGKCCKAIPGCEFPKDLGMPDETILREKLASRKYDIDWWDGDTEPGGFLDRVLYLRPATKEAEGKIFDASGGGECILLGPSGCSLAAKDRPRNCRELEPISNGNCKVHDGSKKAAAHAWRPYQEIIERLGYEAKGKS